MRRFWPILVGIVGLILLALIVVRVNLHFRVESKVQALRAQGQPTSWGELNEWLPRIDDSENGALLLENAFAEMRAFTDSRSNAVSQVRQTNTWSPEMLRVAQDFVQT